MKHCPEVDTPKQARGTAGWNHDAATVAGAAMGEGAPTAWGVSAFRLQICSEETAPDVRIKSGWDCDIFTLVKGAGRS